MLIEPGRPTQNSYIESFNGNLRYECFNEQLFETPVDARWLVSAWRQDYNEVRPKATAAVCRRRAELHRQRAGDAVRFTSNTTEINSSGNPDFVVMNGTVEEGGSDPRQQRDAAAAAQTLLAKPGCQAQ